MRKESNHQKIIYQTEFKFDGIPAFMKKMKIGVVYRK